MKIKLLLLLGATSTLSAFSQDSKYAWKEKTENGYTYKYVANDPMNTRFYTLKNGLSVILSPNNKEPRIAVRIPVRTGSNNDPADHTGLAHYLEHVLFKGTDKYGSLDWAKEKPYLDQIDDLYEQYNSTTDKDKRKAIYHRIDSVSGLASHYSIANEYDKMMAAIGSQGSNAHTWVEETVYEEDIPSNAVDKFLTIQAERFRNPIFRIFHTELEAVYEEKNRSLDNDGNKVFEALSAAVFPTHNYGQQTTIGTVEHLKNPSLKAIREYYYKYYVPNNMAIVMAGDFDPNVLIKKIDAAFSYMQTKPVQEYKGPTEAPIQGPIVKTIYGPSAESVRIGYRVAGSTSHDALLSTLTSSILSNGKAGLMDLNLNKQQKVLSAGAGIEQYKDYGLFMLLATPKEGQTLEEAKDLLLQQVDILKKGNFDESLMKAIVANYKFFRLQSFDRNSSRAENITDEFIKNKGYEWNKEVSILDDMSKITKAELVAFANKTFKDNNYVVVYKRKGTDASIVKVDKPPITPVETNAGKQSAFVKSITETPLPSIQPVWVDYNKDLQKGKAGNADVLYVQNKENDIFRSFYRYEMGSYNNKVLPIALQYLQFLGTDKYSAEDISKEFYNLACSFSTNPGAEETTVTISGLQENFDKAVSLFEHLLTNCKADETALQALKGRLLKTRANSKLNKAAISQGLRSYATYGANNPFNYVLTDDELKGLKAQDLIALLHSFGGYKHSILYFGPATLPAFSANIQTLHKLPAAWTATPAAVKFERTKQTANSVLFGEYDMVQAEVYWNRNMMPYSPQEEALTSMFNGYFGGGMGGIVFQTIRESKALAYSTYAVVSTPSKKEDPFTFTAYVGCQADKMKEAIAGMNDLVTTLPAAEQNFDNAKKNLQKDIETERITKDGIIFSYIAAKRKGLDYDIRKDKYNQYSKLTLKDVVAYHNQNLSGKPYTYTVVGSETKLDMDVLKKYGEIKKLTLNEIFGY